MNLGITKYGVRRNIVVCFFISLFGCATAGVAEDQPDGATVSILNHSGLEALNTTLAHIVRERTPDAKGAQHFFIAKYKNGSRSSQMLWLEGRKLWMMHIGGETEESWTGLRYPSSGELIDLDTGIVDAQEEIGGSTYLTTRGWAADKVYSAVVNGDLIVINVNKVKEK